MIVSRVQMPRTAEQTLEVQSDRLEPHMRTLCFLQGLATERKDALSHLATWTDWINNFVLSIQKSSSFRLFRRAVMHVFLRKARTGIARNRLPSRSQPQENQCFLEQFVDTSVRSSKLSVLTLGGL